MVVPAAADGCRSFRWLGGRDCVRVGNSLAQSLPSIQRKSTLGKGCSASFLPSMAANTAALPEMPQGVEDRGSMWRGSCRVQFFRVAIRLIPDPVSGNVQSASKSIGSEGEVNPTTELVRDKFTNYARSVARFARG